VAFRGGSSIVEHHENIRRRVNPRELPPEAVAVLTECRVPPRLEAAAVVVDAEPGRVEFARDSPLEEAVSSELVSEMLTGLGGN
jgi:hypothetical protein